MFKIVDCERLPDEQYRLVVETDDSSLLTSLSFLDSLIEFTGSFRYRSACALRVKDREPEKEKIEQDLRKERSEILSMYESLAGTPKDRWHFILKFLKGKGKDWLILDDVIILLRIARSERKQFMKNDVVPEQKKSA